MIDERIRIQESMIFGDGYRRARGEGRNSSVKVARALSSWYADDLPRGADA